MEKRGGGVATWVIWMELFTRNRFRWWWRGQVIMLWSAHRVKKKKCDSSRLHQSREKIENFFHADSVQPHRPHVALTIENLDQRTLRPCRFPAYSNKSYIQMSFWERGGGGGCKDLKFTISRQHHRFLGCWQYSWSGETSPTVTDIHQ